MVRGELAIGLFTLRKIKAGKQQEAAAAECTAACWKSLSEQPSIASSRREHLHPRWPQLCCRACVVGLRSRACLPVCAGEELTFDYNFERYGDKPMRCFCGSKKCRKFIGGTQETTANIVELGDADDVTNDPAPVLVEEKETDALVQAMLDKEVGTIQRGWDAKLLGRCVYPLCGVWRCCSEFTGLVVESGRCLWINDQSGRLQQRFCCCTCGPSKVGQQWVQFHLEQTD
jgi:hypothetical protein